ncbi:MAG: GTP-binding protein [Chlamydiales bacterium]|jgi:GTP-binding protein
MSKYPFSRTRFVKTAIWPKDYPKAVNEFGRPIPEFAVAGRSNVGKSSLLNHLFNSKGLVKTSSTPGKTQALNFFNIDDLIQCVDLPGYGFAKVPTIVKKQWGPMIQGYLEDREPLRLLLFLLDIRRTPNNDDFIFLEWAHFHKVPLILVLTKVDKVKLNEKTRNTQKILNSLDSKFSFPRIHYSVTKNIGRNQLISLITKFLNEEPNSDESA